MKANRFNQITTGRCAAVHAGGTENATIWSGWRLVVGQPIRQTNGPTQGRIRPMCLCAFTVIELIVLVVGLLILILSLAPRLVRRGDKAVRIPCVNNLKNIGLAYRIFATDHGDRFPWQTNFPGSELYADEFARYIVPLSNEFSTPFILACPSDTRKPARDWSQFSRENAGYFIGINAEENYPQSFLAGDRNLTTNGVRLGPGRVVFDANMAPEWDRTQHHFQGNVAMADGGVQQLSSARLRNQLVNTGLSTNVWIFP